MQIFLKKISFKKFQIIQSLNPVYSKYLFASQKNYYKILNINETASIKEIKQKYHQLAKQYHPDNSQTSDEDKFKEISEAYSILGDEKKRKKYDDEKRQQQSQQQGRAGAGAGFYHQQHRRENPEDFTNAYQESMRMDKQNYKYRNQYKTKEDYQNFQNSDFDQGAMAEEGFLNTLKNAPELILLTALMGAIFIRWALLVSDAKRIQREQTQKIEQNLNDPYYKTQIRLTIDECKNKSIRELDEITASGMYVLPKKYQAMVDEYRELKNEINKPLYDPYQNENEGEEDNYEQQNDKIVQQQLQKQQQFLLSLDKLDKEHEQQEMEEMEQIQQQINSQTKVQRIRLSQEKVFQQNQYGVAQNQTGQYQKEELQVPEQFQQEEQQNSNNNNSSHIFNYKNKYTNQQPTNQ